MSREKAARIMAMNNADRAVYTSQRNQRSYWQRLDHAEWVRFCKEMARWFTKEAPGEWDDYVVRNNERKAASDEAARQARGG